MKTYEVIESMNKVQKDFYDKLKSMNYNTDTAIQFSEIYNKLYYMPFLEATEVVVTIAQSLRICADEFKDHV